MDKLPREVLHQILDNVFPNSLRQWQLLLVNRDWFAYGITHIWSRARADSFFAVPEPRHQFYANLIADLRIGPDRTKDNQRLVNLNFPRLIKYTWLAGESYHAPCQLSSPICLQDCNHCRGLEEINLTHYAPVFPTPDLNACLRALRSLHTVRVQVYAPDVDFNPSTLLALATLPRLAVLEISSEFADQTVNHANLSSLESPFPALQELSLSARVPAIPSITRAFGKVPRLKLHIHGLVDPADAHGPNAPNTAANALLHLSSMPWLRELKLEPTRQSRWSCEAPDFLRLASLTNLAKLEFHTSGQVSIEVRGLTAADMRTLFSAMPGLRVVDLPAFGWEFGSASLAALGQSCPLLEECRLTGGSFNMFQLCNYRAPLFPRVERLSLWELVWEGGVDPQASGPVLNSSHPRDHAVQIAMHFPKLGVGQPYCRMGWPGHVCKGEDEDWDRDGDGDGDLHAGHEFQACVLGRLKRMQTDGLKEY